MSLVKALRAVQDVYGYLPDDALLALADRMGIRPYRLQEVASFFPHFRRKQPAPVTVRVCRDMACHLAGACEVLDQLKQLAQLKQLEQGDSPPPLAVEGVSCLGRCDRAPVVSVECVPAAPEPVPEPTDVAARAALAEDDGPPHFDFLCVGNAGELSRLVNCLLNSPENIEFDRVESDAVSKNDWLIDIYSHEKMDPFQAAKKLAAALQQDGALIPRSGEQTRTAEKPGAKTYAGLKEYLESSYPASVCRFLEQLDKSSLRGMGGAGAPIFSKVVDVLTAPGNIRYVVANGDESEPGTFKDRELLLRAPHLVVEGVILAGLLLGAERGYIYVRHEYAEGIRKLREAIRAAEAVGACGSRVLGTARDFPVEVFVSPGGYICGEQSALIEAMEDRRAEPRNRPPELATNGLRDRPTLVNNVETLAWLPAIAHRGGDWYAAQGANGSKGRRLFSISGDVKHPGVYELPIGAPLSQLVDNCAGGMRDPDQPLKAIATSGPSGGFVPPLVGGGKMAKRDVLSLPLDIDEFRKLRLMLGAGLVVYDTTRDLADQALNCTEFFRNESCGKCVPCRIGSQKLVQIGRSLLKGELKEEQLSEQRELIDELSQAMEYSSICGLGTVVPAPLATVFRDFQDDLRRHLHGMTSSSGNGQGDQR